MSRVVTRVHYEWDIESVDDYGDIIDHDFNDKCPGLPREANERLVLVRNVAEGLSDEWDASAHIVDRSWAYVEDGALPERFDDGTPVPVRFFTELAKAITA